MKRINLRRPPSWLSAAALVFLAVLALDLATGKINTSLFYVLPVYLAARRGGKLPGFVMAVVCVIAMSVTERAIGRPPGKPIVYWDDLMKLALLLFVAALVSRLKDSLERETHLRGDLELRVRERTAQLELGANELRSFNYALAHHLRSPLRSIARQAGLLRQDLEPGLGAAKDERFDRLQDATRRLDAVIQGMIELSALPIAVPGREEDVDLTALAEAVAAELRSLSPGRLVDLEIAPGLRACGDPRLLTVALRCLLGNAWKFTSKRDRAAVEVGAQQKEGRLVYFVRDNGAGFDMAYSNKLFKPFERLHGPDEYPGLGIGLTVARQIISRHGGAIWAEGRVDGGACIYFTLEPAAQRRRAGS